MDYIIDDRHCGHCAKETLHYCLDGGHERDSSNDYQRCGLCGWWKLGWCSEYSPPISDLEPAE